MARISLPRQRRNDAGRLDCRAWLVGRGGGWLWFQSSQVLLPENARQVLQGKASVASKAFNVDFNL
jgi:hypothetical protein